jgi:hypothetical protein
MKFFSLLIFSLFPSLIFAAEIESSGITPAEEFAQELVRMRGAPDFLKGLDPEKLKKVKILLLIARQTRLMCDDVTGVLVCFLLDKNSEDFFPDLLQVPRLLGLLSQEVGVSFENLKNEFGQLSLDYPFRFCCQKRGYFNCCKVLAAAGAYIDSSKEEFYSPLTIACQAGCDEIVKFLICNGVDVDDRGRRLSLFFALKSGKESIVRDLLEAGAKIGCILGFEPGVNLILTAESCFGDHIFNPRHPITKLLFKTWKNRLENRIA